MGWLPVSDQSQRSLRHFSGAGYDKGRNRCWQAAWFITQSLLFGAWYCPGRLRPHILRAFGASIGRRVYIRHHVRVHWPWKLVIDDDVWLGEGAWLLNLEQISIGHDVCISQEALLCTGSHDRGSPSFEFDNGAIAIQPGAWIAARAMVLRGVTVGAFAVVGAGSVVSRDVASGACAIEGRP
jgi:putative colanic acid biosynthesis acetyltransferase WcaF